MGSRYDSPYLFCTFAHGLRRKLVFLQRNKRPKSVGKWPHRRIHVVPLVYYEAAHFSLKSVLIRHTHTHTHVMPYLHRQPDTTQTGLFCRVWPGTS